MPHRVYNPDKPCVGSHFKQLAQDLGLVVDDMSFHPLHEPVAPNQVPARKRLYAACEPATGLYTHGMVDAEGGFHGKGNDLDAYKLAEPTRSLDSLFDQVLARCTFPGERWE